LLWQDVAGEIQETNEFVQLPAAVFPRALSQIRTTNRRSPILQAVQLILVQIPLVRSEIWPASAAVMAIGFAIAVLLQNAAAIQVIAPFVAAGCIAMIYGQENDPALELALATPTSPWQILVARLAIVFGYNLVLAGIASLALLPVLPGTLLSSLILGWLGPMTFLSAAALAFSLWLGNDAGILITSLAWVGKLVAAGLLGHPDRPLFTTVTWEVLMAYQRFWASPMLLLLLALAFFILALWTVHNQERSLPRYA
jgi:hypothetical protein